MSIHFSGRSEQSQFNCREFYSTIQPFQLITIEIKSPIVSGVVLFFILSHWKYGVAIGPHGIFYGLNISQWHATPIDFPPYCLSIGSKCIYAHLSPPLHLSPPVSCDTVFSAFETLSLVQTILFLIKTFSASPYDSKWQQNAPLPPPVSPPPAPPPRARKGPKPRRLEASLPSPPPPLPLRPPSLPPRPLPAPGVLPN